MDPSVAPFVALARGRRIIVVGSAPASTVDDPEAFVVAVNGGISNTTSCDVWILNARAGAHPSWGPKQTGWNRTMVRQGEHRSLRLAILLTRGDDERAVDYTLKQLARQSTRFDAWVEMASSVRTQVESAAGARRGDMNLRALSAGLFATCLAFVAKPASVTLVGFSWDAGYHYDVGTQPTVRGHVAADRVGLKRLEERFGAALIHSLHRADEDGHMAVKARRSSRPTATGNQMEKAHAARDTDQALKRLDKPFEVVATAPGFYGGRRRKVGQTFMLQKAAHFSRTWMAPANQMSVQQALANAQPKPIPGMTQRTMSAADETVVIPPPTVDTLPAEGAQENAAPATATGDQDVLGVGQ